MKKSGLGRALYYFTCKAQLYVVGILAGSFAMAVYQWFLISDSAMSFLDITERATVALVFITFLVLISAGLESVQKRFAMLVSFGCRRKDAFLGNIVMNLQVIAESLLLFEALVYFLGWDIGTLLLSPVVAFYLASQGASQLIGAAVGKWGKIAYLSLVIVFFVFGILMANLLLVGRSPGTWRHWSQEMAKPVWQCFLVAAAGVFCVAANAISYRILSSYEVKL